MRSDGLVALSFAQQERANLAASTLSALLGSDEIVVGVAKNISFEVVHYEVLMPVADLHKLAALLEKEQAAGVPKTQGLASARLAGKLTVTGQDHDYVEGVTPFH